MVVIEDAGLGSGGELGLALSLAKSACAFPGSAEGRLVTSGATTSNEP
jgi:hypothetical protein